MAIYWLRSHRIGYDTVGVGRGAGVSQPGKCTGFTPVCCGRGNCSLVPAPSADPPPLLPKPTTARAITAKMVSSRRAPGVPPRVRPHLRAVRPLVLSYLHHDVLPLPWATRRSGATDHESSGH